jgi:hypothetical protein
MGKLALGVFALIVVAIALVFGVDWAALLVLLVVVLVGFAYSAGVVGDWLTAWGRRSSEFDRRKR